LPPSANKSPCGFHDIKNEEPASFMYKLNASLIMK
jgi:hypothetical protein